MLVAATVISSWQAYRATRAEAAAKENESKAVESEERAVQQQKLAEAFPVMADYLRRYPVERSIDVRLLFAHHLIGAGERPRMASKLLAKLEQVALSDTQKQACEKLKRQAQQRTEEIEIEEMADDL